MLLTSYLSHANIVLTSCCMTSSHSPAFFFSRSQSPQFLTPTPTEVRYGSADGQEHVTMSRLTLSPCSLHAVPSVLRWFFFFFFRETGKNHPVRGDPPVPALTAHWAVTDATPRPAHHRPSADKVRLNLHHYIKYPYLPPDDVFMCIRNLLFLRLTFLSYMWYILLLILTITDSHITVTQGYSTFTFREQSYRRRYAHSSIDLRLHFPLPFLSSMYISPCGLPVRIFPVD